MFIELQELNVYSKCFEDTKHITLKLEDEHKTKLKRCNKIWSEVKSFTKKDFDTEPVYNDESLKI